MMIGSISAYGYGSFGYGTYNAGAVPAGATGASSGVAGLDAEEGKAGVSRASSPGECQTCKNRKYVDGSDEANVSFKAAAHVDPSAAGAAVRNHEGQHVSNAYKKAAEGDGQVVRASVSIHMAVCPECGRSYVSGGTTRTTISYTNEQNPYQQNRKSQDSLATAGANVDLSI